MNSHNAVDQVTAYVPPTISGVSNPATSYSYNLDQIVTGQTRQGAVPLSPQLDPATGLAVGLTTPQGQYAYTRDPVGRITDEQAPGAIGLHRNFNGPLLMGESTDRGATASAAVGYQYDANFWLTHLDVSVLGAIATGIDYGYDDDGLLTSASVQSQATMALARSPQNGLLTGTTLGLVTDSWSYNAFAEPSAYAATFNGTALYASSYTRDKLGRITQKVETVAGLSETSDYAYDLAGRLDAVTVDGALIADYGYDSNSNRVGVMQAGVGIPAVGCAAGLSNVSASVDAQDRLLTYGTCTYQYTDNGELNNKTDTATSAVTTYQYDSFSNLRHVSLPDGRTIDYQIDGRNRRIGKSINGVIVQGLVYLNDLEPVAETDAAGNRIATFVYADRANTPSYLLKGGNVYRVISDHLGSVRLVVNVTDGSIAQRLDYDAWGQVLLDTNPGFQPFGFAGGIYDQDTGLVRFGARDYDPEVGRWTNKDPIGFGGDDGNLYGYVNGNPISFYDPYGLFSAADLPTIPQPVLDFGTGVADAASLGLGPLARKALGVNGGVNKCSKAYAAGELASLGLGLARMAYAGLAKVGAMAAADGAGAMAFRNGLKRAMRGPLAGSDYRIKNYADLVEKYGSDEAIQAAAGRTSDAVNAVGADLAIGGAVGAASCECQ